MKHLRTVYFIIAFIPCIYLTIFFSDAFDNENLGLIIAVLIVLFPEFLYFLIKYLKKNKFKNLKKDTIQIIKDLAKVLIIFMIFLFSIRISFKFIIFLLEPDKKYYIPVFFISLIISFICVFFISKLFNRKCFRSQ